MTLRRISALTTFLRLLGLFICLNLVACDKAQQEGRPPAQAASSTASVAREADDATLDAGTFETDSFGVNNKATLRVIDISERNKDGKNGVAVTFSTPLDNAKNIQSC